jgi:hypothetical protein
MRYTQSQVRELLSLPLQTYRYWASSVPHLSSRAGKTAAFSTGDLLGLALTKQACIGLGVGVGRVRTGLDQMFGFLDRSPWPTDEGCTLVLCAERGEFLGLAELGRRRRLDGATLLIPCAPVIDELRARLLPVGDAAAERQGMLPLLVQVAPPRVVAGTQPPDARLLGRNA